MYTTISNRALAEVIRPWLLVSTVGPSTWLRLGLGGPETVRHYMGRTLRSLAVSRASPRDEVSVLHDQSELGLHLRGSTR